MYLKRYQERVTSELSHFFDTCAATKEGLETAIATLPEAQRHLIPRNWVESTFDALKIPYNDKSQNGLGNYYPRAVIKVPTGGGKTLLAIEAIKEYQTRFAKRQHGLVVWIVPSETIYSQTIKQLKDKSHHMRQFIDQSSGGKTIILEKGQKLTQNDIQNNLVILFIMIQSVSRANNKEALKVFQDSGGYEGFFPADNRYDIHEKLTEQYPNLDCFEWMTHKAIKSSLGNAIRVSRPLIIIDEIHKVFTDTSKKTVNNLNPEMVLGLSATPKADMNIVSRVSGLELKEEEMIKLDMHLIPPSSGHENDWKTMLQQIKDHRVQLEKDAVKFNQDSGKYIRPMALIQVEATGKDQRGKGRVHALDVKEYLIELGVNADNIAIKSSSQNDIEDINLLSKDIEIRYIITKEALKEGWDNPFAYILGVIPNASSSSSMTQLVGRILRQPYVKKTGIISLDESYVYFCKGSVVDVLKKVEAGFKAEGLEELIGGVTTGTGDTINTAPKQVKIKEAFADKTEQFYLPVWIRIDTEGKPHRFNYARDIKEKLVFSTLALDPTQITEIQASLSDQNKELDAYIITIDNESKVGNQKQGTVYSREERISYSYITRRFTEIIENPFLARSKAGEFIDSLISAIGEDKVHEHFGYIVSRLVKLLQQSKEEQEESLFKDMIEKNQVSLAILDDDIVGCRIPDTDTIDVSRMQNPYNHYLYDDLDLSSLNSLEQNVGTILDKQDNILWWLRNKTSQQWYAIQGWRKNKIRPDFIVGKKKAGDALEIVYILESKGEHLVGSDDTKYKKKVLDLMTEIHQSGDLKIIKTTLSDVNEHAEAYLIEQGDEERDVRTLMM